MAGVPSHDWRLELPAPPRNYLPSALPFEAAIQAAAQLKHAGNEEFKRAKWAVAGERYSSAVAMLECQLPRRERTVRGLADRRRELLLPLLSNRAEVLLRCGEPQAALVDCDAALALAPDHAKSLARRERAVEDMLPPLTDAELRALLRALLPSGGSAKRSAQHRAAAAARLRRVVDAQRVSAARLFEANGLLALLAMAQAVARGADLQPVDGKAPNPSSPLWQNQAMADAALRVIGQVVAVAEARLDDTGWTIAGDEGQRTYFEHIESGERSWEPPAVAGAGDPLVNWAAALLLDAPTLVSPRADWASAAGVVGWPVSVLYLDFGDTPDDDVAVLDVRGASFAQVDEAGEKPREAEIPAVRQLILGAWRGRGSFIESEMCLADQPGAELESWYTTTLVAATAVCSAAGRGRVLVLGLGGGSMASFIQLHFPAVDIDAVEIDGRIVKVATSHFGLQARERESEDQGACRVHTTDAFDFLAEQPDDSFDAVIVDVYTQATFPERLLCADFFANLACVVRGEGIVAINAGIGHCESAVMGLVPRAFASMQVLRDDDQLEAGLPYENGVVIGTCRADWSLSAETWPGVAQTARSNAALAPALPFKLRTATQRDEGVIGVCWTENDAPEITAAPHVKAAADDEMWDLF